MGKQKKVIINKTFSINFYNISIFYFNITVKSRQSHMSHLPDLLNGTEIDPINYTNFGNADQQSSLQQFGESVSDWGDNLNKVLNDHMKFVPKMSENIALMNSMPGK